MWTSCPPGLEMRAKTSNENVFGNRMITISPSEHLSEGNPFSAEMLLEEDSNYADLRITPPCRLGEKAIEHMCEAYGEGNIGFDINVETSEATLLTLYGKDMNIQSDDDEYFPGLYVDITVGLLDLLGRAHNAELFRK